MSFAMALAFEAKHVLFLFVSKSNLPHEVVVKQRQKIENGAVFTGNVERDAPLHEAYAVRIIAVGDHKPNASF